MNVLWRTCVACATSVASTISIANSSPTARARPTRNTTTATAAAWAWVGVVAVGGCGAASLIGAIRSLHVGGDGGADGGADADADGDDADAHADTDAATENFECALATVRERCFRQPVDDFDDADGANDVGLTRARRALISATRFAIMLYADLVHHQALCLGPSLADWTAKQRASYGQPIQDPLGALFAALLAVRWLRPGADDAVPGDERAAPALTFRCRRRVGALVTIMHKYLVNAPPGAGSGAMLCLTERLLTAEELDRWGPHLRTVAARQIELEAELVATVPVYALHAENPLTEAERELMRLRDAHVLDADAVVRLRAAAFFVLGACLLDPVADVLERMNCWVSCHTIGRALVTALLTCAHAAARPGARYRFRYPEAVDRCAIVMLGAARAPHAAQLRVGPYAVDARDGAVAAIVAPETLEAAWNVFQEAERCYA